MSLHQETVATFVEWGLGPTETPLETVEELLAWFEVAHLADAQAISYGLCDTFTDMFIGLLGRGEWRWTPDQWKGSDSLPAWAKPSDPTTYTSGHFWVEVDGLHYDAETPEGVENWRDLPIFKREVSLRAVASIEKEEA